MFIWLIITVLLGAITFTTLAGASLRAISIDRLRTLREEGGVNAARIEYWLSRSERITWTLRVTSMVFCVALSLAIATLFAGVSFTLNSFLIVFAVTAFIVAFPGGLIPLAWGTRSGEKIGLKVLPVLKFFGVVLYPFTSACETAVNAILRFRGRPPLRFTPISLTGELERIVGGGRNAGTLDEEEKKMIRHIFEFGDTEVREIMTPRVSMRCLSGDETVERALGVIGTEHHSRIPVYRDSPDNIVGVLYAKDLLTQWGRRKGRGTPLGDLAREALFVPESKKVDELFDELRREKTHMAIVVDEYGCTSGLVTMEDVLEEIVGEIQDEYDQDEKRLIETVDDGVYRVDARLTVSDAREEMGIDFPLSEEYETLAGFVYSLCGRVPAAGESIDWKGCAIRVVEASMMGVTKLEIIDKK